MLTKLSLLISHGEALGRGDLAPRFLNIDNR
jgi:hypothetical protein